MKTFLETEDFSIKISYIDYILANFWTIFLCVSEASKLHELL